MSDIFTEHNNIDAAVLAERAAVVAWLRGRAKAMNRASLSWASGMNFITARSCEDAGGAYARAFDAIERGEHLKGNDR